VIDETTSLADVAGAVAAALRPLDYDPVVVGGSAATLHAPEAYRSADVDMVIIGGINDAAPVIQTMAAIGFRAQNGMFVHDRSPYTVDFVPSPVAIAGDVISDFASLPTAFGPVRVLQAGDVVNDRLNKYVAYDDQESFEVAVAVGRMKTVDISAVEAFMERQAAGVFTAPFRAALARFQARLGLGRREISTIGFTTTLRLRFVLQPTLKRAQAVARGVQAFLDEKRAEIDGTLDGITIRANPDISFDATDPAIVTMTVDVRTKRALPPVDRFALAESVVDYLRESLAVFPELAEVPDDGTPPVSTSGP
jgi:hypothetical protein